MTQDNLKLIQWIETFLMENPALTEFATDLELELRLPHRLGNVDDSVQRFHDILQAHPSLNSMEVLEVLVNHPVAFALSYLGQRLRLTFDDDPLYILAKLLQHLDSPTGLRLVDLLREVVHYPVPPMPESSLPRDRRLNAYAAAVCSTIEQLVTPHLPQRQSPAVTQIAAALGPTDPDILGLLRQRPTLRRLLRLHEVAQHRVLERIAQDWPPSWLAYDAVMPPDMVVLTQTLGMALLDYAEALSDRETIQDYLYGLELPDAFVDVHLGIEDEEHDPWEAIPDDCQVYLPVQEDADQVFVFSSPEAARVFAWCTSDRQRYTLLLDNAPSWFYDPLFAHTAYNLRHVLLEEYAAPLPPDTFPVYLNLAQSLTMAPVPDDWMAGGLSLLHIDHVGTMTATHLAVVLDDDEYLVWPEVLRLTFSKSPIHVYLVVPDNGEAFPVALILTTNETPGNPEQHRRQPHHILPHSEAVSLLILETLSEPTLRPKLKQLDALSDKLGIDVYEGLGKFTKSHRRYFLGLVNSAGDCAGPITLHVLSDGYMLQLNPRYTFVPTEMEYDWDNTRKMKP